MHTRPASGITIDSSSTKDIDDAIRCTKAENGSVTVQVSIADVGSVVHPGASLAQRAGNMVETRYFARGNQPMLPRLLSEQQLSLLPGKVRPGLTVEMVLDARCAVESTTIYASSFISHARLSYDEIPAILKDAEHAHHAELVLAWDLAKQLLHQRRSLGAMVLYDVHSGWVTTEEGFLRKLERREDTVGYIIVQELMVLCNAAVARWCIEQSVPVLFRNHTARTASFDRTELMRQIDDAVHNPLQNLDLVQRQTSLLFDRATYSDRVQGHFGLNLPAYLHFTSPIRRMADLVSHWQVRAAIDQRTPPLRPADLQELAGKINAWHEEQRKLSQESWKKRAERIAQGHVETGTGALDGLSAKDFERVTRVEVRSGKGPSDVFSDAMRERAAANSGHLPLICVTLILTSPGLGPEWRALRQLCIDYLARGPEQAVSVLAQATQISGWPAPQTDESHEGPAHLMTFTVRMRVALTPQVEVVAYAPVLKRAKQMASIRLLAQAAHCTVPGLEDGPIAVQAPAAPASTPKMIDRSKDPISALMEYAQATKQPMPQFDYVMHGLAHLPSVTCTARFAGLQSHGTATSKQAAKKDAAAAIVSAIASGR